MVDRPPEGTLGKREEPVLKYCETHDGRHSKAKKGLERLRWSLTRDSNNGLTEVMHCCAAS